MSILRAFAHLMWMPHRRCALCRSEFWLGDVANQEGA